MVPEFPFGTFRPGGQDYFFKGSVATGNFPPKRPEKSCAIYFPKRLRVVPQSSGIVERRRLRLAFLAWGDFHAHLRFARSTIPEEKWGTTRSLLSNRIFWKLFVNGKQPLPHKNLQNGTETFLFK